VARIYVIDDDEQLLRMVGLMLERGGHTVTLISSPIDGLEQIKIDKPDLLVLDVMMPNMSGHDLAREIRGNKGLDDLPILVLTARSQEIDRTTALKSGADDYLSKPVTSQELIERVDGLLTKRGGKSSPAQGILIAFFGLRGGVGRTTLAVNLAAALRRVSQQEVCLVDFSPSGSQAVMHIRLQARSSWADLSHDGLLDWSILKNRLLIHPSGLRVLAAPTKPQPAEAPPDRTAKAILALLRDNMAFTIVDLAPTFNAAFRASLEAADMALHVITPDVVSVQTAVQVNRLLTNSDITVQRKSHILNQITAEAQLPQKAVERGLNARMAFQIGFDSNQARAIAQGVPLALTPATSPLPAAVKRMAEAIWHRVAPKSR